MDASSGLSGEKHVFLGSIPGAIRLRAESKARERVAACQAAVASRLGHSCVFVCGVPSGCRSRS